MNALLPLLLALLVPDHTAAPPQEPAPDALRRVHVPPPTLERSPTLVALLPPSALDTPDATRAYVTHTTLDAWTILAADPRDPLALHAHLDALAAALHPDTLHLAGPPSAVTTAALHHARLASLVVLARGPVELPPGEPGDLAGLPVAVLVAGEPGAPPAGLDALAAELTARGAAPVRVVFRPIGAAHEPDLADPALARVLADFRRSAAESARRAAVERVLDDFHAAAAAADGSRYFACFAPGAVFVGTDATEHWSLAEFRAYAEPYFSQGRGWRYDPVERSVAFGPSGDVAWFDERLHNAKYGETRGSGVLVRSGERWRIAQYVLSFPVPNELAPDLVERVRALGK